MTANQKKSYLSYFNKLVDQFNNTYHRSIGENLVDSDFFCFDWRKWIESWSS